MSDITKLLSEMKATDARSSDALLSRVYDELRRLASAALAKEKPGQTIQATALVHEAYLRLVDVPYSQRWSGRRHFFAAASEAMRRILVDQARRKKRLKHGGEYREITVCLDDIADRDANDLLLAVHDVLDRLEDHDSAACQLVKLRYFSGLSHQEAAELLQLPRRTADRTWAYARAWLKAELAPDDATE